MDGILIPTTRLDSIRNGRGFYRLPPLPIRYDAAKGKEISTEDPDSYYPEPVSEVESPSEIALRKWNDLNSAIEKDDIASAGSAIENYLAETSERSIDDAEDRQKMRNTAYDMLDAMTALKGGASNTAVATYLRARAAYHQRGLLEEMLPSDPIPSALVDNWAYLKAAHEYSFGSTDKALSGFTNHIKAFPKSEKNQAARYMLGRILTEKSYVYEHDGCGAMSDEPADLSERTTDSEASEALDVCRDENWSSAMNTFRQLVKDHPTGRYANDSRGWIAYLHRRGGERAEALAEYYKLLGDPSDRNARLEAKKSLQIIGHAYEDSILDITEKLIANDVNAAMAYAYHRIYNQAVDLSYSEVEYWYEPYSDGEQEHRAEVARNIRSGTRELERTVRFAEAMMKRHPQATVNAGFMVRISEAELELQKWANAKSSAAKAVSMRASGELRAQALWVIGSAQHALKDSKAARTTFTKLVKEFPASKLTKGARRLIAIAAEDEGDLAGALEQYVFLDYKEDIAYFLDVLMPLDQFAAFTEKHADLPGHDQRLYSLGLRYMREGQWDNARIALRGVKAEYVYSADDNRYGYEPPYSKEPDWEDRSKIIRTKWVMQDLQTIDTIEHLENAVAEAEGDEAIAEAMYQLASFQYDADPLLFYNPSIWKGARIEHVRDLETGKQMRQAGESQGLLDYSKKHETMARAIPIYQQIVEKYPNTKAAKDAIYSMVVAHEKLSNMNEYWREIYGRGLFAGTRRYDNSNIRTMFPKFRWPISRINWHASTRTVNGGSPYEAMPKPKPPLSFTQKVSRKLSRWYVAYSPAPVAAVANGFSKVVFYVKLQLILCMAAFFVLILNANSGSILAFPSSRAFLFAKRSSVSLFRYITRRIADATPRLSVLYLLNRISNFVKKQIRRN